MTDSDIMNLDMYLAGVIHNALLKFRENLDKGTLVYSHVWEENGYAWEADENVSNDTEWFLNELLWTFDHLRDEGSIPESTKLFEQISGESRNPNDNTVSELMNFANFISDIQHHPDYQRYKELQRQEDERVKKGLMLFAKYFRGLWY